MATCASSGSSPRASQSTASRRPDDRHRRARTDRPASAYPVPRPESRDDRRFCFGLAYDVGKVLHQYGYPPMRNGRDILRIQQALFRLIYQEDTL